MMDVQQSWQAIRQSGLIVVLRALPPALAVKTSLALYEVGVRVVEVTVDSPDALESIASLHRELPSDAVVGAGTVLDAASVSMAVHAGARFLFAPNLNLDVIQAANRLGRIAIPGVMTPTEMVTAVEAGAMAVKLFPANVVGEAFLAQVRGPLPHIPVIPTGGISESNVARFIKAGAVAVGAGGSLLQNDPFEGRFDAVKSRARRLLEEIAAARGEG